MIAFRTAWAHVHGWVTASTRSRAPMAALVVAAVLLGAPAAHGQSTEASDLKALGHVPTHGVFSQFPWERIDTLTGNVLLSFTDLVLPGHAGFDLAIRRTWNANELPASRWRVGVGPILHVGGAPEDPSTLGLPDGSVLTLVPTVDPGIYVTDREFWRVTLTETERKAELPNGTVWSFQLAWGSEYFPVHLEDPYGNAIDVTWDWTNRAILQLVHHVGSETRLVEFTYYDPYCSYLKTITYGGRTWQYVWSTAYPFHLTEVIPPEGPSWHFSWTGSYVLVPQPGGGSWGRNDLAATVTLPAGGWVRYETSGYTDCGSMVQCRIPSDPATCETVPRPCFYPEGLKLRARTTGGPSVSGGSWSFTYEHVFLTDYDWEYRTTITGPDTYQRHTHTHPMYSAMQGTPLRESLIGTGPGEANVVERTTFDWQLLRAWPGDPPPLFRGSYKDFVPTAVETVRHGRTYRREFTYDDRTTPGSLGHFGQPVQITETGDFARTTTIAYQPFTGSRWLADAIAQVTVDGVVTSAATYHPTTGFATSRTALGVTTTFVPGTWGNVASQKDANNHWTSVNYTWGAVSAVERPLSTTTFGINSHGETITATQRGFTTAFAYDGLGRQTRVDPPVGNATVTTYAPDASWVKVARGPSWTITSLDGFGRAIGTETSVGVKTQTTYNALGQVTYASGPYSGVPPAGTQFSYDPLGRVVTRTNPDSSFVQYVYGAAADGLRTTITDEKGRQTQQIWQASGSPDGGRLARVVDAAAHETAYTYTVLGSLSQVSSPGGVTRTWTYDTQNRLLWQEHPESGRTWYLEYDNVGNLKKQRDAELQETQYTYDANNRLTQVISPDPLYTTTMTYDASDNRRSVSNGYVSTTFDYDGANRLTRRTDVVNNRTFVSAYTPDANGNVADVQYPSSNRVRYTYDTENRVVRVADPARGLTFATDITYHPAGGLSGYTAGDGATHSLTYDSRQRPARFSATGVADLPDLTYGYDGVGNVLTITDVRPGKSATFGYDALDRLTSASGGGWGTATYGYDPLGNRLSKTVNGATTSHVYTSQRLTSTTGAEPAAFEYDASGNQTRDALGGYAYTPTHMLETATLNAGAVYLYHYDGDGQRTLKRQGSITTTYYLRGLGQVLSEFEEGGGQLRWTLDHVYLGSRLLAAARPPAGSVPLTITKAGAGAGTVTSTPTGINCGTACSGTTGAFAAGTVVTLSATAAQNWVFVGWSGEPDCADGVLMLTDAKTCVATFAASAPAFAKQAPAQGTAGLPPPVTLQWAPVANASYWVCWDTSDNGTCDTSWQATGTATSLIVPTLATGTYYWQVKTQNAVLADDGTWWSFAVTAPALFTKVAPSAGASGLGSTVTLQWTSVPNEGYAVCWDTTDNGTCDSAWWPNGGGTVRVLEGLSAGTHYWQVKTAGGGVLADNGTWAQFSVSAPALYVKQAPATGATGLGPTVTLQWTAVPDEGYWVCWDTTNNNACDSAWWPNGGGTARVLEGLTTGTYYWQVKTAGGGVLADNGVWHAFTVAVAALFTKVAPANGATGLGSTVTLQWTAVPDEGYWVCWDTTNNNACDSGWWPNGGGTVRVLEGLSGGTYFWQVKTAGGGVLADNGAWHQFTVAASPAAVAWSLPGASRPPVRPQAGLLLAGAGLLGLLALAAGVQRRRRVVMACALFFLLGAAPALAQTTTQVIEYYTTDAIGSVRAVTKQVNGTWQVVARHDFMPFGEEVAPPIPPQEKRLFTGKERDHETGLDYFEARYLRTAVGRFTTVDPLMTLADNIVDPQKWNRYAYVTGNPLRFTDPDGRDRMGIYAHGFQPTPWRGWWEEVKSTTLVAAVFAAPLLAPEAVGALAVRLVPLLTPAGAAIVTARDNVAAAIADVRLFTSSPVTASRVTAALNAIRDHAKDRDIQGAVREAAGVLKGNHGLELQTVLNSLGKVRASLLGALKDPGISKATRSAYLKTIAEIDDFIEVTRPVVDEAMKR